MSSRNLRSTGKVPRAQEVRDKSSVLQGGLAGSSHFACSRMRRKPCADSMVGYATAEGDIFTQGKCHVSNTAVQRQITWQVNRREDEQGLEAEGPGRHASGTDLFIGCCVRKRAGGASRKTADGGRRIQEYPGS